MELPYDKANTKEAVRATIEWLNSHEGWLLILDNADDPVFLKPFLPTDGRGHILLTSRASESEFDILGIDPLKLGVLPEKDAVKFLLERTRRKKVEQEDREAATELAKELGYLPLALEQAGAYMAVKKMRFDRYLEMYRDQPIPTLESASPVMGEYEGTVATTWKINMDAVGEAQRDLLHVSAFLAPDRIPFELIEHGKSHLGDAISGQLISGKTIHDLLEPLHRYSLVGVEVGDETYSIHRMVQEVAKESLPDRPSWAKRAVQAVGASFPSPTEVAMWPRCNRLVSHASHVIPLIDKHGLASEEVANLFGRADQHLDNQARYSDAEVFSRRALGITRSINGDDTPAFATRLNNLAQLLKATNRLEEAEPLMRRALEIDEQSYGEEHPNVAIRLNNLAQLLKATNRLEEAEPLMRRALEIDEQSYGEEHPDVAIRLNNLAALLQATNRLEEAEPLMRRALEIDEQSYGEEHPDVAIDLNNLAQLLTATNRLEEAEPLMRRALEIDEQSYGEEHPDVAIDLNNLAQLLQDTNRLEEAEPLMERVVTIFEKSYGEEHPQVAVSLNNLAALLQATNRLEEAEPLMRRALEIDEQSYGEEHPNVAIRLNNLAQLLQATNRLEEAEPLMRRMVEIFHQFGVKTGHPHPHMEAALGNYFGLLSATGRSEDQIIAELRGFLQ